MNSNLISILLATACLCSGQAFDNECDAIYDNGNTICYGYLGCFEKNNSIFTLDVFPASPDRIGTSFRLFTRENKEDNMFQMLTVQDVITITNSRFNPSKETKMVVHGYISNGHVPWIMTMKNELLKAGDFNVILVDWEKGANVTYNQATANCRVVGAEIANLITVLEVLLGANAEHFHIIGHSLGAHISGYAGERLHKLGRITGLDPAEPNFQYKDKMVRLDPTDATFVDVIHTDGKSIVLLGFGMIQPVGHVDFYPNGGLSQPGCSTVNLLGQYNYVACNHLRAIEYFTESINSACPYQAYKCQSYADFERGACMPCFGGGCGYMGFYANRAKPPSDTTNVIYFLNTGSSNPFCRYHYKIKLSSGNESDAVTGRGQLVVNLMGSNGQQGQQHLTYGNIDIEPGVTYGFVVTSRNDIGTVNNATVTWHESSSLLDWLTWSRPSGRVYIDTLEIFTADSTE
ncbi:hypothetical protein ACJMK2_040893, partial [Sinanodonta woodiana]